MTPAARIAAAIPLLDAIAAGEPAERALTNWGRAHRFAGSGDRAAVRDHVYDALRCRSSFAALGGGADGRGLMLGMCRAAGIDPATVFTGAGHAPALMTEAEAAALARPVPAAADLAASDWPDWLLGQLRADLGADFDAVSEAMRARAPVFLRVNLARATVPEAAQALAQEGIATEPHPLAATALRVLSGARRIAASQPYLQGLVELQDVASQAAIGGLALPEGARVLDYCAGGGGKALALAAAHPGARITAHDIDPGRMKDIPPRAARAGARIALAAPGKVAGVFDLVLVDAPCSGSGTWRRTPEAKWRLTPARLAELTALQDQILDRAAAHVAPGGQLLYMTCSLLSAENDARLSAFVQRGGLALAECRRYSPRDGGDGFFAARLCRL
ncbi:RsmB/NOP family class I SAM-dependent RNA methyltransferase [Rhodobacter capsulatus]|uniref:RsmB/NOP family class I SAM-dependent RNA methyltransferase n=1 Tax=Rhodobacter capsulatus TaxID=1061 RepID=UPI0006DC10CF|nr:RsmB/NOP family class I SAM-dependent RNA methyltransferase [Rhodobacter capsulatus]KQB17227.1 SAM-dependent methyltransferase [Rhodobacter capsulatus]KQB17627.1 SAM-dependent methyltransferase [Rhodobacter capsulatus]PZX27388.1 16S rRNA (cytosine967-C5)-methyltransferase [Rhodobacter capsulatus]QNR64468.1 RsmB/NOP family class I SAM-dependent RNA methyltransferase [Rhodobacter capsulatus]